jgi:hypothetical protein
MSKFVTTLLLTAGLTIPIASFPLAAQERDHDRDHRYYDTDRKDYHEWNTGEERAWHRYWEEQHRAAVQWERANEEQRRAYWRWRHEHPDARPGNNERR